MSAKHKIKHKHTLLGLIGGFFLLMAIAIIVAAFQHSELGIREGKSVIIDSTGLNRNILITRTSDSASVAFDSQVICVKAPCPEIRIEDELKFSERGLKHLDEFLAKFNNGDTISYASLNYKDKRIIKSVTERKDDDITKYSASIYKQNGDIYTIDADRELNKAAVICMTPNCESPNGERKNKKVYDFVENLCAEANESATPKLSYSALSLEEQSILDEILSEPVAD